MLDFFQIFKHGRPNQTLFGPERNHLPRQRATSHRCQIQVENAKFSLETFWLPIVQSQPSNDLLFLHFKQWLGVLCLETDKEFKDAAVNWVNSQEASFCEKLKKIAKYYEKWLELIVNYVCRLLNVFIKHVEYIFFITLLFEYPSYIKHTIDYIIVVKR